MNEEYYQGEMTDIWLEDGILYGVYKVETVDLQAAKAAAQERLNYIKGNSYLTIVDYRHVKTTEKEARDYLSSEEPAKGIIALAVLIDSNVGRMVYNFFISINKPSFPTQVFNKKEKAMEWLQAFK